MNLRIEVLPGLYLAKKNTIDNGILNNIQGIKKVINVQDDINEIIGISKDYTNVAIKNELIKYSKKKLIEYLKDSADTINQCYNECLGVLVICDECDFVGPSIILNYLITYGKFSKENAITLLKTKKKDIFSNENPLF